MTVDEIVRERHRASLLEMMVTRLKESIAEEEGKLSADDRAEVEEKFLALQAERVESMASDEEVHRSVRDWLRRVWEAIDQVPLPGEVVWMSLRCEESGESVVEIIAEGRIYEVEVLESIRTQSSNFFHPIIQWAIKRCTTLVKVEGHPASKFMKKLPAALRRGIESPSSLEPFLQMARLRPNSLEYCTEAWSLVREAAIEGGRCPSQDELAWLGEKLHERLPDQDHEKLFEFLRAGKLPRSRRAIDSWGSGGKHDNELFSPLKTQYSQYVADIYLFRPQRPPGIYRSPS